MPLFLRPPTDGRTPVCAAFTLVELLIVLALIGALVALSFNVAAAAQRHAAAQQARAELAVLTTALASYRRHFGEYPQTDDSSDFWAALMGRAGPTGLPASARRLVDPDAFRLGTEDPGANGNAPLDPWGQRYRYRSFGPSSQHRSYALYSCGPDGRDFPPDANGAIDLSHADNLDNVYADHD